MRKKRTHNEEVHHLDGTAVDDLQLLRARQGASAELAEGLSQLGDSLRRLVLVGEAGLCEMLDEL